MKIRLLKEGYKGDEQLYLAFKNGEVNDDSFFSEEIVETGEAPDFPFYMGKGSEEKRKADFLAAFQVIANHYVKLDRDIHFDERFWHSLLITKKRAYILENYPQALDNYREFCNIVIKVFDWENYIYKCILAVEYVEDSKEQAFSKEQYYELIIENLDIFNYLIKYSIFRNGEFLIKVLTVIHNLGLSEILKAKITDRPDLGKDERYGRRVIFELNKAYPVLMSPLLDVKELEVEFLKALGNYYDVTGDKKEEEVPPSKPSLLKRFANIYR
ncbi:hypothetical protein BN1080_02401 [Planococcus massiliensis]|uniref:Uncharacterized protein n=1 Tax=Planococcus massiliensis TaxID=1499687 RepID=A0A098ENM8_9BACL|nr:hypothetical protein [Planococcus massiliensis]CEG23425.1 hypothetical protein BN1080_02401 [Planococcus massiliensis]